MLTFHTSGDKIVPGNKVYKFIISFYGNYSHNKYTPKNCLDMIMGFPENTLVRLNSEICFQYNITYNVFNKNYFIDLSISDSDHYDNRNKNELIEKYLLHFSKRYSNLNKILLNNIGEISINYMD